MGEKLFAGLVAAAVIAPLCAVCILGPAVLTSIFTGIAGWLGGFGPVAVTGLSLVTGIAVYAAVRRRKEQCASLSPKAEVSDE
jgi:membrane protein implicated in regulation of membrane protease activity